MVNRDYKERASVYAMSKGIKSYKVEGKYMIYNISYLGNIGCARYTIQYKIDLDSMQEYNIRPLKRFDKTALVNLA